MAANDTRKNPTLHGDKPKAGAFVYHQPSDAPVGLILPATEGRDHGAATIPGSLVLRYLVDTSVELPVPDGAYVIGRAAIAGFFPVFVSHVLARPELRQRLATNEGFADGLAKLLRGGQWLEGRGLFDDEDITALRPTFHAAADEYFVDEPIGWDAKRVVAYEAAFTQRYPL